MAADMSVSRVCKVRPEVMRGELLEVVKLHLVREPGSVEADPETVRRITYPSQALKLLIEAVAQKLVGRRECGTFLIGGSYGTGKSHNLLVTYHIFRDPVRGKEWVTEWGMDVEMPEACRAVVVNVLGDRPELLWEPIFAGLGRSELNEEAGDYPNIEQVRSLAEDGPVVIIVDELVPWYEALDEHRQIRTRNFLQVLTEVADERDTPIAFVCSILRQHPDLTAILNRHEPYNQDLSLQPEQDRSEIVRFRLLEGVDWDAVEQVSEGYEKAYSIRDDLLKADEWRGGTIRERIKQFYPFHPQLMTVLFDAYQSCAEFQNMRGVLYLLGSLLRHKGDEADLLLTGDLDPRVEDIAADLRQMGMELVSRCIEDMQRCFELPAADRILATILAYSFLPEGKAGATASQVLLGSLRPGDNPNQVEDALRTAATERAWFIHQQHNRYLFKTSQNLPVVCSGEARRRLDAPGADEAVAAVLAKVLSERFDPGKGSAGWKEVVVFPGDAVDPEEWAREKKLWEQPTLKAIVSLAELDGKDIFRLLRGGKYRNTAIWVVPNRDLMRDNEIRFRAMRVAVCDDFEAQAKQQGEAGRLKEVRAERRRAVEELKKSLAAAFGSWLKLQPGQRDQAIALRPIPLDELDGSKLWQTVSSAYTEEVFRDHFRTRLQAQGEKGILYSELIEECLRVPGYPLLLRPHRAVKGAALLLSGENGEAEAAAEHENAKVSADEFERMGDDKRAQVRLWLAEYYYPGREPPPPPPPPGEGRSTGTGAETGTGTTQPPPPPPPPPPTVIREGAAEATSAAALQDEAERMLGRISAKEVISYKVTIEGGRVGTEKLSSLLGKLPRAEGEGQAKYRVEIEYEEKSDAS